MLVVEYAWHLHRSFLWFRCSPIRMEMHERRIIRHQCNWRLIMRVIYSYKSQFDIPWFNIKQMVVIRKLLDFGYFRPVGIATFRRSMWVWSQRKLDLLANFAYRFWSIFLIVRIKLVQRIAHLYFLFYKFLKYIRFLKFEPKIEWFLLRVVYSFRHAAPPISNSLNNLSQTATWVT